MSLISAAAFIVESHPDYKLFTDNCQNFGQYLIRRISSQALCPDTIQNAWSRLLCPDRSAITRIPGGYPESCLSSHGSRRNDRSYFGSTTRFSTTQLTYYTARTQLSFDTSSGDTWVTATPNAYIGDEMLGNGAQPESSEYFGVETTLSVIERREKLFPLSFWKTRPKKPMPFLHFILPTDIDWAQYWHVDMEEYNLLDPAERQRQNIIFDLH